MKTGLILGKFMPLHMGHIAMADFALQHCDELVLLLCSCDAEPISGLARFDWLQQTFMHNSRIKLRHCVYNDKELPATSASSHKASFLWAQYLAEHYPEVDMIFTSEPYGVSVAEYLNITHISFDEPRNSFPVSSSAIRRDPFAYWNYLPAAVKPFYVKKVCISGTESTGKSTLTKRMAEHFHTTYVPEMARELIDKTSNVTFHDLNTIATTQASAIDEGVQQANKLLFCDTDLNTTRSYAQFLFSRNLIVEEEVEAANKFHLYLFLEADCPFVQDGTRLSKAERDALAHYHRRELEKRNIAYVSIAGDWEHRFRDAVSIIEKVLFAESVHVTQLSTTTNL